MTNFTSMVHSREGNSDVVEDLPFALIQKLVWQMAPPIYHKIDIFSLLQSHMVDGPPIREAILSWQRKDFGGAGEGGVEPGPGGGTQRGGAG